jgi:hypothetical protein
MGDLRFWRWMLKSKENEKKMRVDMMNDAAEMLEAAGIKECYYF